MHKVLGVLVALFYVAAFLLCPAMARAETMSSEQQVVIHAEIAATRYIIVNDQGQMITIYSNTNESVTPEVHSNSPAGALQPLTDALYEQYQQQIQDKSNLAGVAISVPITPPTLDLTTQTQETTSKFIAQLSPPFFIKS